MSKKEIHRFARLVDRSYTAVDETIQNSRSRFKVQRAGDRKLRIKPGANQIMKGKAKPIVIIQCASKKNTGAVEFKLEGKPVKFVGQPELAPSNDKVFFVKPDDPHPRGKGTWRDLVVELNSEGGAKSQFIPAARLYNNPAYRTLLEVFGEQNLYILSAGWGLVRASYLLPDYDITLRYMKEDKYKQRFPRDVYKDFNHIREDYGTTCELPIFLFSGKDYRPLFTSLMEEIEASKSMFFRTPQNLEVKFTPFSSYNKENGLHDLPYPTSTLTNWQYPCAEAFAEHYRSGI